MKVHFGGSGKGSIELFDYYVLIRDTVRELGHSITRDWLDNVTVKNTTTDEVRYEETAKAINKSDVVILEGTYDTSSVGKQLDMALNVGVPVLILHYLGADGQSSLDKFVTKNASKLIKKSSYNPENIKDMLEDFFVWVEDKTKLVRFNLEIERDLDNFLKDEAKKNHSSKSEEIRKLILRDMNNKRK